MANRMYKCKDWMAAKTQHSKRDAFTHNDRSELTAATMGGKAFAYDYDNIGNRKTAQEEADAFTYTANALNQYTQITENSETFAPEFDADGNQTRIKTTTGIWTADYNALNRPITYTRENEDGTLTVITADYDYMGRRVYKKVETVTPATPTAPDTESGEDSDTPIETRTILTNHRYLYRGYLQIAVLDLTRTTLNALWYITWDPTEPIATRPLAIQKDGTWYTYGLDLPKNITEVYGTNGGIKTVYTYSPYGLVTSSGNVTQPIQWSSEYTDTDLGLVYYNYRHYNPLDGRWTGRDFIMDAFFNFYCYIANKIKGSDYLGLAYVDCLSACVKGHDYSTFLMDTFISYIAGGLFPKNWLVKLLVFLNFPDLARELRVGIKMSKYGTTTIPSAVSLALRLGGTNILRTFGRICAPIAAAMLAIDAVILSYCASHCLWNKCYKPSKDNILNAISRIFNEALRKLS